MSNDEIQKVSGQRGKARDREQETEREREREREGEKKVKLRHFRCLLGRTALMAAAFMDHAQIVEDLLRNKADIKVRITLFYTFNSMFIFLKFILHFFLIAFPYPCSKLTSLEPQLCTLHYPTGQNQRNTMLPLTFF